MFAEPPDLTPALPPAPDSRLWTRGDLLLGSGLMLATFGGVVVAVVLLSARGMAAGVVATVAFEGAMAVIVFGLAWRRGISWRQLGFGAPTRWTPMVHAWLGSYGILFGYGLLLVLLRSLNVDVSRFEGGNPLPIRPDAGIGMVVALGVLAVLVAPFCEEVFFRAFLFRGTRSYLRLVPAALVSGAAFALFHVNLAVVVPFTLIGALFAWAMEQSRSLWPAIAAHFLVNSLSFVASIFAAGRLG